MYKDHPRIRGEHLESGHGVFLSGWIIPAYAGSTRRFPTAFVIMRGSSPHTRGAPVFLRIPATPVGIIPAYAGSTTCGATKAKKQPDHPRIRGEHDKDQHTQAMIMGSSPHTRGAPISAPTTWSVIRIIPAYAGSTRRISPGGSSPPDHPRIRGEHMMW